MKIYLQNLNGYLHLCYESKYTTGSSPIETPADLVREIENVCGKGSYCLYYKPEDPAGYATVVDYFKSKDLKYPTITYWQQGVKTEVIEAAREVAIEVWGNIPEMQIGWLENQCKSYIEDLK